MGAAMTGLGNSDWNGGEPIKMQGVIIRIRGAMIELRGAMIRREQR